MSLYQKVNAAYMNALDNDYNLDIKKADWIAYDMQTCDSELENESYEQILECVKKIQSRRQING